MLRVVLVMSLLLTTSCATSSSTSTSMAPVIRPEARRADAEAARAQGLQLLAAADVAAAVVALQRCADGVGTADLDLRDDCFADLARALRALDDDQGDKIARAMLTSSRAALEDGFIALASGDRAVARRSFEAVLTRAPHAPHAIVAREQLTHLVDVEAAPEERPVPVGDKIRGSLDPDHIRREVRAHADEIRACYETQLTTTPTVAGKIIMRWGIDGAGVARQAIVSESGFAHAPVLDACLIATVRSMRFPAPTGGGIVLVNYPFVFKQP